MNLFDPKFPSDINLTYYDKFNPNLGCYSKQSPNYLEYYIGCY